MDSEREGVPRVPELIRTDLNQSDVDVLEALARADGRDVTPGELATETGWSKRTIYRVVARRGVVERNDETVRLRSRELANQLASLFELRRHPERGDRDGPPARNK